MGGAGKLVGFVLWNRVLSVCGHVLENRPRYAQATASITASLQDSLWALRSDIRVMDVRGGSACAPACRRFDPNQIVGVFRHVTTWYCRSPPLGCALLSSAGAHGPIVRLMLFRAHNEVSHDHL